MWMMLRVPNARLESNLPRYRTIDPFLTVRAIKRQIDGALGSRGAWLLAPYADLPSSAGLNTEDPADIEKTAEMAIANGYQLCVHAIGDRANREVLDLYERVFRRHPDKKDLRWRIEHAQHMSAADIPRFGKLGRHRFHAGDPLHVGCALRAGAAGPEARRGGRLRLAEAAANGRGGDQRNGYPGGRCQPHRVFYATVSRRMKDGKVFYPDQRMSRMEALQSYTLSNAYAAFEENTKGSLQPDKLADITVLSKDILTIPEEEFHRRRWCTPS